MKRFLYLAIAAVTAMSTMGCDGYYGPMRGGWNHMMNYGYGCGFGGMFMWILFVIIIGIVAYFIIQNAKTKSAGGTKQETPLDILKKSLLAQCCWMYYNFIIQISCCKEDGEIEQGFFTQITAENSVGRRGASNPHAGISILAL